MERGVDVPSMSRLESGLRSLEPGNDDFGDRPTFGRQTEVVFNELPEVTTRVSPVQGAVLTPGTAAAEEFRLIRTRLRMIAQERPYRCVGLVSATPGEGKTTVALGLACSLADAADRRVLLIDADLRKPSVEGYLGIPPSAGLTEWLRESSASVAIRRLAPQGFWLLSAGKGDLGTQDGEATERMSALLNSCRKHFDHVVVDCPPLIPVADAVMLQDLLDGFLLVVRSRYTPREMLLRALSQIKSDRIGGIVFNDQENLLPDYASYSAYRRRDRS
jgi:capsular exopolysaccharide synthesis family protein